jgi:imidazolonepropionase-like amidohydrolase
MRLPAFLADPASGSGTFAFTGARVFSGGGPVTDDATVVVENGRIASVGRRDDGIPDGARTIELSGKLLMPGIIDAHAHLSMLEHTPRGPHPDKGEEPVRPGVVGHLVGATLRRAVRMGITTIRDVGAYGDVLLELRQGMRYGAFVGPRLLVCGRIVSPTAPGGRFFPGMYREADGADEMRKAVREQIRAGADFVKIMSTGARSVELENPHPSQCTREEMAAFVDEAHRQGYRAAAHCEGLGGTELAVLAGADTIEHGFYLNQRPDLLDELAGRRGVLVPTLSFLHDVAEQGVWTDMLEEQGRYNVEQADMTLRAARDAGVLLAMGYDSPESDLAANEIVRMVEHGLTNEEALVAATHGSATALGIDAEVGTIEPGKLADLVVVDGDPLSEPGVLLDEANIWLVMRNGSPAAGAALDSRLATSEA